MSWSFTFKNLLQNKRSVELCGSIDTKENFISTSSQSDTFNHDYFLLSNNKSNLNYNARSLKIIGAAWMMPVLSRSFGH